MDECFICGITGNKVRLFDAICDNGIFKVCQKCSSNEHIPIVRKPTTFQLKEEEKNLAVSNHLPKLSAGYFSETVTNEAFRGFRLGVTVPLWENANTINKAKSEVAHAEAEVDRYTILQEKEIRQQLNKLETLRLRVQKLEEALGSVNSMALLTAAMENGEISLSEYFYTSDFYFRNQQQLLRYRRDLLIQEAALLKVYL